jgi:hypothetical protein
LLEAILDVQAYFPFAIGIYQRCMQGPLRHLWYAWHLPDDASLHIQVHAFLSAICKSEIVPKRIKAEQNQRIAELCKSPIIAASKTLIEFFLKDVCGIQSIRCSDKADRISEQAANDAAFELAEYIAAGYDATDMRFQNGREPDKAFQPFMNVLAGILERRSLAAEERRQRG